jgi:hypothetical protein
MVSQDAWVFTRSRIEQGYSTTAEHVIRTRGCDILSSELWRFIWIFLRMHHYFCSPVLVQQRPEDLHTFLIVPAVVKRGTYAAAAAAGCLVAKTNHCYLRNLGNSVIFLSHSLIALINSSSRGHDRLLVSFLRPTQCCIIRPIVQT